MFSFRRKPSKKADADDNLIRPSPSLPELSAQSIPWPSNLVDLSQLPQEPPAPRGAAKTSFTTDVVSPVPFHKPWTSPGKATDSPSGLIASLYASHHPPSAFETRKSSIPGRARPSQRRVRNPTTFNLMVAGAQGTGKTSLLRLILNTADISPTATADQKAAMDRFLHGAPKRTDAIQSACVEICESKYDRLLLSVIDTPGLDFQEGHELKLERQVSTVVKYLDTQFSDTLSEESKVVRQSKGDQHIHLCIYMIDPTSVMTETGRRAQSSFPTKVRSEATISYKPPDPTFSDESESEDEDDSTGGLTMSPTDIRVIRRLSVRANVLPVVARADSLTDGKLAAIKKVIRRDLCAANLDFGVFGPVTDDPKSPAREPQTNGNGLHHLNGSNGSGSDHSNGSGSGHMHTEQSEEEHADEEDKADERRSPRAVIKLRPARLVRRPSRSRSRLEVTETSLGEDPASSEIINDTESVASRRFSAHIVAKTDLTASLPFALITPEHARHRRASKGVNGHAESKDEHVNHNHRDSISAPSEDGHAYSIAQSSVMTSPTSPTTPSIRNFAYLQGPPADLKGVFVRKFRWGTVDVLSPEHCDFAALRTAVLSTHIKLLKIRTKEVLYEKFRTEKLLARRATANISEDQTKRLLEDLGL